jgi:hypothetical protein
MIYATYEASHLRNVPLKSEYPFFILLWAVMSNHRCWAYFKVNTRPISASFPWYSNQLLIPSWKAKWHCLVWLVANWLCGTEGKCTPLTVHRFHMQAMWCFPFLKLWIISWTSQNKIECNQNWEQVMGFLYPSTQRHYRRLILPLILLYCYMFWSYDYHQVENKHVAL